MKPSLLALAMVIFLPLLFSGQSRWMRTYHPEWDTPMLDIVVSYDGGYLISGRQVPNYPKYNWLIKTDINGEILWEKLLGDGISDIVFINMDQNRQGEIFLAGLTGGYGDYSDPVILKLDECGDKVWCRVLPSYDHLDYAYDIRGTDDGGCATYLRYTGTDYAIDRVCLMKFDAEGNSLWKQCYNSPDPNVDNADQENLIITPDHGFLLSGYCYYRDPDPPHYFWLHPYFIKIDSFGTFQWELVVNKETSHNGGEAFNTVISPDSQYFYSAAARYYHESNAGDTPALIKIDMEGNLVGMYDLAEPDYFGKMFDLSFLTDSTLAVSAIWGDESNDPKAVIIDTAGNIINYSILLSNDYMGYVRTTHEGKILYYTMSLDENENFDVFLFKLNQQLIDDTLYLQPFLYDSLCSYYILSDTLSANDCGLIVDIDEKPADQLLQTNNLRAWPNPCRDYITISFNEDEKPGSIDFYSVYGQHLYSQDFGRGDKQITIKTENIPPGIIIVVLRTSDNKTFTLKIIKL